MNRDSKNLQMMTVLGSLEGYALLESFLPCLSGTRALYLQKKIDTLKATDAAVVTHDAQLQLKAFCSQDSFSRIASVHPAWILGLLKEESPRVIGILLRYLPSKHVRYLLAHLPKQVVTTLPKWVEAFSVPGDLVEFLRRRLERSFVPAPSLPLSCVSFEHLFYLKIEEIEVLASDLGLSELSLALVGVSKKILKPILNRFTIDEAKEIVNRMKMFESEPRWFLADARYSILDLGEETLGIQRFLEEAGTVSLAKGFTLEENETFELFKQKMSPEKAYILKRYIEECSSESDIEKTNYRKDWILKHVERLSVEKRIDPEWLALMKKEAA